MKQYDVIFIGSGHACWHGALLLKMAGKKVALVERDLLGGTCTNYGCDAKILLDSPVELTEALRRYRGIGLQSEPQIDWTELMQYKKAVIGGMPDALGGLFGKLGFEILRGEARFVDEHTVEVGGERYGAKYFVIGTGQDYIPLDIPGKEYFHDSREFLSLDELPEHTIFVGAGIISMEFASICLSLGKKVSVVSAGPRALENYPEEYAGAVTEKMIAQGARFCFGAGVEAIEKRGERYLLRLRDGEPIEGDYVLVAVGRRANIDRLNLSALGIEASARGVRVDGHLRTACKHIYASGDVVDKTVPKLTPTAEFESNYIAMDILNPLNPKIRYPAIPNLVFTLPRIAQVGVTVADAEAAPEKYRVEKVAFGETMAWLNKAEREAHITYVFDRKSNRLIGAAILSEDAGVYVDMLTLIINKKIGLRDLSGMIFSFPTPTYGLISSLIPLFLKK